MIRALRAATVGMLLLAGTASPAAPPGRPMSVGAAMPRLRYTVRGGDNLYQLAINYLVRREDFRVVQRLNQVRDPLRLVPGSVLTVPIALLRTSPVRAQLAAFRGAITLRQGAVPVAARLGIALAEGAVIGTGANAFASLRLDDGSIVTLPSNSQLRIARLRRILLTGQTDRIFRLDTGRSQMVVVPRANPADRFEMQTPVSSAAVRGTEFRVSTADGVARTEVIKGIVAVRAGADETAVSTEADIATLPVSAGQGTRTTVSGTAPVRLLLAAPALERPSRMQAEPTLVFRIASAPAGSAAYRVQVAGDAGFVDLVSETSGEGTVLTLPGPVNGTYFVRVTAIAADGMEGLPRTYAFERYLNAVRTSVERRQRGRYLFRWQDIGQGRRNYRFVLVRADGQGPPVIDEPGLTRREFVVARLPAGTYKWRVLTTTIEAGRARSSWSGEQSLAIDLAR